MAVLVAEGEEVASINMVSRCPQPNPKNTIT